MDSASELSFLIEEINRDATNSQVRILLEYENYVEPKSCFCWDLTILQIAKGDDLIEGNILWEVYLFWFSLRHIELSAVNFLRLKQLITAMVDRTIYTEFYRC